MTCPLKTEAKTNSNGGKQISEQYSGWFFDFVIGWVEVSYQAGWYLKSNAAIKWEQKGLSDSGEH